VNAPACSQTGCSGWAPAPELSPLRGSGCRNLALPGVYEQASTPFPNLIQLSFLQNLTHTTLATRAADRTRTLWRNPDVEQRESRGAHQSFSRNSLRERIEEPCIDAR
jgi:hypothetical protein